MASKSLAVTLYAILTDKKKVKGKTRLQSMLKSGRELKVFAIRHEDLKTFCNEAKRYGVLYSVLKEKTILMALLILWCVQRMQARLVALLINLNLQQLIQKRLEILYWLSSLNS
ncbi:PcfB family protein [Allocoprobacillus halotolerans]|uniref:PcfB family protein n=1 Tax=Allocoprobacillus halotolerans TaxID=2944914 RepID=A0ABY5I845_9FIRM|nr:PcfB family protein [Allocoprobacillus halotolerans]UTY40893.1 PcfB family protein [Allocoprobacillus halotolerans]